MSTDGQAVRLLKNPILALGVGVIGLVVGVLGFLATDPTGLQENMQKWLAVFRPSFALEGDTVRTLMMMTGLLLIVLATAPHLGWVTRVVTSRAERGASPKDATTRIDTPVRAELPPAQTAMAGATAPPRAEVPTVVSRSEERLIVDVTAEYLADFFINSMAIHGKRLVEPYIGKWMKVSGPLGNIMNSIYSLQVTFSDRGLLANNVQIFMFFDKEQWLDRVSVLKRGDHLTVLGQIKDVSSIDIHLEHCELISP